MTSSSFDPDQARKDLYEVMNEDLPFEQKAERVLYIGEEYLDVDNGHLTRIEPESDYWKAIASTDPADGPFPPGLLLDLQTTYCRRTVEDGPVVLSDAPNEGWEDDPAFEEHGLHCYHGTTITVDDKVYGTVCFVSNEPRDEPFTAEDTMFADLIARVLEHELNRQQTQRKLERLEQFASVVSHDLRNPLDVAQMRLGLERDSRDSEHLEHAANALDRMENLIDSTLAIARQGQEVTETKPLALSTVVEDCWQTVKTTEATIEVVDDLTFRADPDRINRLLENLFRNAIEHAGSDVSLRVGPLDEQDGFYIEDDGPGIPESEREQAFETGYSTGDNGTGLGLAVVQSIVSAHGWSITITESTTGGARFEISDVVITPY